MSLGATGMRQTVRFRGILGGLLSAGRLLEATCELALLLC